MFESNPISGVSGVSKMRMVFTDTVINTYSAPCEVNADNQTQSTMRIATYVNCKTLLSRETKLNGFTKPDFDYCQPGNGMVGCYAYNSRGEMGSTTELFA